jgi:hypothetical protein
MYLRSWTKGVISLSSNESIEPAPAIVDVERLDPDVWGVGVGCGGAARWVDGEFSAPVAEPNAC